MVKTENLVVLLSNDYDGHPNINLCIMDFPDARKKLAEDGITLSLSEYNFHIKACNLELSCNIGHFECFRHLTEEDYRPRNYNVGIYDKENISHLNSMVKHYNLILEQKRRDSTLQFVLD